MRFCKSRTCENCQVNAKKYQKMLDESKALDNNFSTLTPNVVDAKEPLIFNHDFNNNTIDVDLRGRLN
jgi:hypothetical protein